MIRTGNAVSTWSFRGVERRGMEGSRYMLALKHSKIIAAHNSYIAWSISMGSATDGRGVNDGLPTKVSGYFHFKHLSRNVCKPLHLA